MKTLSTEQLKLLSQFQSDLHDAQEKVESAMPAQSDWRSVAYGADIADFNTNVNELWSNLVLESLDNYNKLVQQVNEFVEETRSELQSYYDERSEKWQESDHGQDFQCWLDEWDSTPARRN